MIGRLALMVTALALGVPGFARHAPAGPAAPGQGVTRIATSLPEPAGLRLAKRYCAECHATADGHSPLPDAPPFADLHRRYPAGCLDVVLAEGMLAPLRPGEEGGPRRHPRMPMVVLGDDERAELTAYLLSLDPRPRPAAPLCGNGHGSLERLRPHGARPATARAEEIG